MSSAQASSPQPAAAAAMPAEDPGGAIRVLTVDDSASMRALLLAALSSRGFAVEQAEDGQEALEWLATNEVDVIITDINMPRLDGFGLIEKLRTSALHADRPILVLTTESSDEKKKRARDAGATGWIVKPFDADKLTTALRRVTH
jgi:two-component system chemotaxis response regulator CheY